jgi:hypothetical protein
MYKEDKLFKTILSIEYTDSMIEDQSALAILNGMSSTVGYNWYEPIALLEEYCENRGWIVEYSRSKDDEAIPGQNLIVLNKRHKPEILYYFFLHELGHMLMVNNDPKYNEKYKVLNERSVWSQTYRVGRVEEEIEAWNKGLELAFSLGLTINQLKYEELKASMVSSYMLWANQRKHPHEHFGRPKPIPRVLENEEQQSQE